MSGVPVLRFGVKRCPGGNVASVALPRAGYSIGAAGANPADALHRAAHLAEQLCAVLGSHPELAPLLPPQIVGALKRIKAAAFALKSGTAVTVDEAIAMADAHVLAGVLRGCLR